MRRIKVSAIQMKCGWDVKRNIKKADSLVRKAAYKGAKIILLQELFERVYFPQKEKREYIQFARKLKDDLAIQHFKKVAKELKIVLPISFYERFNQARYNSIAVIDSDGVILGVYRKSHIPEDLGYQEKYYFNLGDTGFKVWHTKYANIGIGICWDQWFPEAARIMALKGAELLFYPSAIGSTPINPSGDSKKHWQICMQGHAAANLVPVVACNRIGKEKIGDSEITFYGSSFITDEEGNKIEEANRSQEEILTHEFDLNKIKFKRFSWGVFRDRRPDLYKSISSLDGNSGFK